MQDERYIIIKMVEEGKINAAEAVALMEALGDGEEVDGAGSEAEGSPGTQERTETAEAGAQTEQDAGDADEERKDKEADWSSFIPRDFADHVRDAVQSAMKNMPQLKEEFKDQWHSVKHDLKRSLSEVKDEVSKGVTIDIGGIKKVLYRGRLEHEFVEDIDGQWDGESAAPRVQLMTHNGSIAVRAWDQPDYRITLRKYVRGIVDEKEAKVYLDDAVRIEQRGDGVEVIVRHRDRVSVSIEAFLPRAHVYALSTLTRNGGLVLEGFKASALKAATTNGGVTLQGLTADELDVSTTNGGIVCGESEAGDAKVLTTNGGIRWEARTQRAHLRTTNGRIVAEPGTPEGAAHLSAQTTNASVHVLLPVDDGLGVRLRAAGSPVETAERAGIAWHIEKGDSSFLRRITGETAGFDQADRQLTLDIVTSNGRVRIDKKDSATE